jgi:hypothetical protein
MPSTRAVEALALGQALLLKRLPSAGLSQAEEGGSMSALPPTVRARVERILDREARRLLAEELDGDSVGTATRVNRDGLHGGSDQVTATSKAEVVPIIDRDSTDDARAA